MGKRLKNAVGLLAATLFLFSGAGQAGDKQEDIEKLLQGSGFNKLFEHIPQFTQAILKQTSGALEPEVSSQLSKAFTKAFRPEQVKLDVVNVLNAHYDEAKCGAYLAFIEAPQSQKMAQLERSTNNPDEQAARQAFAAKLKEQPTPSSRAQLITRLDQANGASDFSINIQAGIFKAVFTAIDPILDSDMKLGKGEMDKMVDEVRASLKDGIISSTRFTYLYAFRSLDDQELESYVKASEGEGNRWATQLLSNAVISAINRGAERSAFMMQQAALKNN